MLPATITENKACNLCESIYFKKILTSFKLIHKTNLKIILFMYNKTNKISLFLKILLEFKII